MHAGSTIRGSSVMCKYKRGYYKKLSTFLVFIKMARIGSGVAGVEDKVHRCIKRECKD